MHIAHLHLTNFRSHADIMLTPGAGLVVLAGPNGAGKTNILEAVSLLSPGRGLRGAPLSDMVLDGSTNGFAVVARCISGDSALPEVIIGTAVQPDSPGRRRARVNGADAAVTSLSEWLSILWLTPAMDRLFVEAASQRRRFLDRLTLALAPSHAHHSSRYEAAMRSRSRLLTGDVRPDPQWLDALEAQMGEHGCALDAARHWLVNKLRAELASTPKMPFVVPQLAMVDSEGLVAQPWDADTLCDVLHSSRGRDAASGRALCGPHRVDLAVTHRAKGQAASRCSTGEQKAMLLSIILSHGDLVAATRGQRPILLLDELAAHLDPQRRAALFSRLASSGGQVWMTGTEMGLFDAVPEEASRWSVESDRAPAQV